VNQASIDTRSPPLVRWLLREGLIDELHLLVHPVAVGAVKRLFEPGGDVKIDAVGADTIDVFAQQALRCQHAIKTTSIGIFIVATPR
jgi:dihydrofolate reductase